MPRRKPTNPATSDGTLPPGHNLEEKGHTMVTTERAPQLREAEAALVVATAELAAATAEAAQWTQHYLSIEPRIRLGTLAAQDPSIAPTREAFAQARVRYRQAWGAYTAAQEDVQAAQRGAPDRAGPGDRDGPAAVGPGAASGAVCRAAAAKARPGRPA